MIDTIILHQFLYSAIGITPILGLNPYKTPVNFLAQFHDDRVDFVSLESLLLSGTFVHVSQHANPRQSFAVTGMPSFSA